MAINRNLTTVAERIRFFGERECRGYSPLYEALSAEIAEDPDLVEIASHARDGQPAANMIFAAAHFHVLKGADHPLAQVYAEAAERSDVVPEQAFEHFRSLCLDHRSTMIDLMQSRRVQTNEIGRCALLAPAFSALASSLEHPLAVVEIGTSAGLLLNWHRYRYVYESESGDRHDAGDPDSSVTISSAMRGDNRPPIDGKPDTPATSIGIDYNPIDVSVDDDALWLRALVWPDQKSRGDRLRAAIEVMREHPVELREGDGVAGTDEVLSELPGDVHPVLFHAHALYQFPEDRQRLADVLDRHAASRDLTYVSLEWGGPDGSHLEVTEYRGGSGERELRAVGQAHGGWVRWGGSL